MIVSPDSKAAAKNGAADAVRAAFDQAIAIAKSAGLSRAATDKLYREAWNDAKPLQDEMNTRDAGSEVIRNPDPERQNPESASF